MSANESSSSTVYGEMAILVINGDSYTFIPEWDHFTTIKHRLLVIIHVARHVLSTVSSFSILPSVQNSTVEGFWPEFIFQGSWHIDAVDNVYRLNIHIPINSSPAWIQGYSDEGYESDNEV
ncbi:uncharacterized protein STEHIDRAFT_107666 [Stereum hirsutum FP-91666 SS1]|uniref:uncharacterized protein n=1 Tax=Stereum hirsutum (strain FP-91666) TaxID=721885 RepID=UPI000440CB7A|nr:uncharacterized protein STEHIDRAFT_107666 [Stereum hirsutum FP-91666 SS1]EIM90986.1 hypothetical protein STEHIDRAFT_107666 [Stereum hirsutum FP-91666 SS1]